MDRTNGAAHRRLRIRFVVCIVRGEIETLGSKLGFTWDSGITVTVTGGGVRIVLGVDFLDVTVAGNNFRPALAGDATNGRPNQPGGGKFR